MQHVTHAPCGARDWADMFRQNPWDLDAGSSCLLNLSASLGPGGPAINIAGILNPSSAGGPGGTGAKKGPPGWADEPGRFFGSRQTGRWTLYALYEKTTRAFLKWGITMKAAGRYTGGKYTEHEQNLDVIQVEIKSYEGMAAAEGDEKWVVERWPGQFNYELETSTGKYGSWNPSPRTAADWTRLQEMLNESPYFQQFLDAYGRDTSFP
jgi:hypothetical protein